MTTEHTAYNTELEEKHAALMHRNAELSHELLRANHRVSELESEDRDWKECALSLLKAERASEKLMAIEAAFERGRYIEEFDYEQAVKDILNG